MYSAKPSGPIVNWGDPLTKDLLVCLPISENAGIYLNNQGSSFLNPTPTLNGGYSWVKGIAGPAINLNGSSAYVLLKSGFILGGLLNSSVSMWFNTSTTTDASMFYDERSTVSGNDIWRIEVNISGNGFVRFTYRDDAGTLSQITGTKVINDGKWHHLVLTKAGTAVKTYIDGVLDLNSSVTGTDNFTNTSVQSVLGKDPLASGFLNGKEDNVLLYNRTLTHNEAKQLFVNPWRIYQQPNLYQGMATL